MNDLRTQDTNTIRQKSKANDSRAGDALTCPLGCAELVFSRDDLKWEHVRSAHPECLSEALEEHIAPAATDNIKNPPVLKSYVLVLLYVVHVNVWDHVLIRSLTSTDIRNDVILEGGAKSPSVESMKVEPLSRSSTPKRPPSGNPVQQSNKTRQALHSPKLPLRDSRASLSVPSTSRKRSASDVASATPVPRHPPQQQSLEAQPRVVRSGESKLGISGSSGVDSKLPPVMGHARNHPSLSNVNLSADQYEQPNRLEQPVIHDSEEAGLVSAHYPDTGIAARSKSFSMAKAVGKPSQLSTNDPPQSKSISYSTRGVFQITAEARYPGLIMQPDSRPISHDQLAAEVKGIYGGLVMVEGKCISVDSMQMSPGQQFTSEHWQALVALHRTLLHEHHDFLLASQHPSANSALRKLAAKYSMPGRMWKHGIHSFLELMRRYLPDSREYMIAFILLAYQMMALLYETVPAFEQTWIECLGDLGRYRMAVEEDDYRDRETWGGVARSWYSKAADQSPEIGRLYHHLAILAGPNALQKLFYYVKALTCEQPFPSARESILTLFDPLLSDNPPAFARSHPGDANFIRLHAMLYGRAPMDHFEEVSREYINQLDGHIGRVTAKWNEAGVYTAVANIAGILDYGSLGAQLFEVYQEAYQESVGTPSDSRGSADKSGKSPIQSRETSTTNPQDTGSSIATDAPSSRKRKTPQPFEQACRLALDTLRIALNRIGDKNILPHVHVFLVFVLGALALPPQATQYVFERFPWDLLAFFLNTLASSEDVDSRFQASSNFWKISSGDHRPLPEDFLIRGQIWCRGFFPDEWFNDGGDVEERMLERASTSKARAERILWIGTRIGTRIGSVCCIFSEIFRCYVSYQSSYLVGCAMIPWPSNSLQTAKLEMNRQE